MSLKSQTGLAYWQDFETPLRHLLSDYGLSIATVVDNDAIPGSFWGENEAGLASNVLHLRSDTPLHSALHEAGHFICMDTHRRVKLHTNAGGDYQEENAVCYLQAIMADSIPGYGRNHLFSDMDQWGYSFRLGSAQAWFEQDAEDAQAWLLEHGIIDRQQQLTGRLRQ